MCKRNYIHLLLGIQMSWLNFDFTTNKVLGKTDPSAVMQIDKCYLKRGGR